MAVLWDVVEEHLAEAEYLVGVRAQALESPSYTLTELAEGPEERLLAHLDALTVGGVAVADGLLQSALSEDDTPWARRLAAAAALVLQGREGDVWRALWAESSAARSAAQRALVLAASPRFDTWLEGQLASDPAGSHRAVVLPVAAGRGLAVASLLPSLQAEAADERAAALVLARGADPARHLPAVEALLHDADPRVRDEALLTALVLGSFYGYRVCVERALDAQAADAGAMVLLALVGRREDQRGLLAHLARDAHRRSALVAMGYSGHLGFVPALLEVVAGSDEHAARLAGEAVMGITGLRAEPRDTPDDDPLPPLAEDDLDADLAPAAEAELPLPDATSLAASWERHRPALPEAERLLEGAAWSTDGVLAALESGPLRRRHALARWLLVSTGGAAALDTRALVPRQRDALAALRLYTPAAVRSYG